MGTGTDEGREEETDMGMDMGIEIGSGAALKVAPDNGRGTGVLATAFAVAAMGAGTPIAVMPGAPPTVRVAATIDAVRE
jgi:hypothetical protein